MTLLELSSGVAVVSHHVDALELSCTVDQAPHLVKGYCADLSMAPWASIEMRRVRRDNKTAEMVCELEAKLDLLKRKGERINEKGERDTGWTWDTADSAEPVRLLPEYRRKGHTFALETSDWLLMIRPFKSVKPRFSFQLRADYLLELGAGEAYRNVVEWWTANIGRLVIGQTEGSPVWRISRIDLTADIAGISLNAGDLSMFTTRLRQRNEHHSCDGVTGQHVGKRFTGLEFGKRKSPLFIRVYDKTFQAAPDALIRKVWEANGYIPRDPGQIVWRVEFQLRSGFLREMLREDGSRLSDDPARMIEEDLDALWREVASKRLLLKSRTGDARIERRPVRDWWEQISALDDHLSLSGQTGTGLRREAPVVNDSERFLAMALRNLATVGLLDDTPRLSDCIRTLSDFCSASGGQRSFAELIARAEVRRDPSRPNSKPAIALRTEEIVGASGFSGTSMRGKLAMGDTRLTTRCPRRKWSATVKPGSLRHPSDD